MIVIELSEDRSDDGRQETRQFDYSTEQTKDGESRQYEEELKASKREASL
jgi:hypothetical protein